MKNQILKMSFFAILMLGAFGCEKKELSQVKPEEVKEEKFAVAVPLERKGQKPQKSIIIGTWKELESSLMSEKPALLKSVNKMGNVLLPTTGTVGPVDPDDRVDACWKEIMAIVEANRAAWIAEANEHCLPVFRCLGCPDVGLGLAADFYFYPTARKCFPLVDATFKEVFKPIPFPFTDDAFDSAEVQQFINELK